MIDTNHLTKHVRLLDALSPGGRARAVELQRRNNRWTATPDPLIVYAEALPDAEAIPPWTNIRTARTEAEDRYVFQSLVTE